MYVTNITSGISLKTLQGPVHQNGRKTNITRHESDYVIIMDSVYMSTSLVFPLFGVACGMSHNFVRKRNRSVHPASGGRGEKQWSITQRQGIAFTAGF